MLTIQHAHSPVYATADGATISLQVKFEEFAEELPFGANAHDPMPHGVELYNRSVAGEFGEIGQYTGPDLDQSQPTVQGAQDL